MSASLPGHCCYSYLPPPPGSHSRTDPQNVVPHRSSGQCILLSLAAFNCAVPRADWVGARSPPLLQINTLCCQVPGRRRQLAGSLPCTVEGGLVHPLDVIVPLMEYPLPSVTLSHCIRTGVFPAPGTFPRSTLSGKNKVRFHHSRARQQPS